MGLLLSVEAYARNLELNLSNAEEGWCPIILLFRRQFSVFITDFDAIF